MLHTHHAPRQITDYTSLLTIYFVGYVLAELPCNWVLKLTSPPLWLPTLTLLWGIVSVCMGLVHNQAGMFAVRFLCVSCRCLFEVYTDRCSVLHPSLGITEAGLFPGTVYVFSRFYKRAERTTRVAFFFSAASASGAFGGVLAYGLTRMDGIGGKRGWQWLFIIEGLLTIVVSVPAYWIVPNYPHLSSRFTDREKQIIEARLRTDSDALDTEGFSWSEVWRALTTLQVYGYCFLFHGFSFGLYTLSLFLPSIIQQLGYKSWQAQLLTVPVREKTDDMKRVVVADRFHPAAIRLCISRHHDRCYRHATCQAPRTVYHRCRFCRHARLHRPHYVPHGWWQVYVRILLLLRWRGRYM